MFIIICFSLTQAFCAKLLHGTTKLVSIGCDRCIHVTPLPLDEEGGYQGPSGGVFGSLGGLGGLGGGRIHYYKYFDTIFLQLAHIRTY